MTVTIDSSPSLARNNKNLPERKLSREASHVEEAPAARTAATTPTVLKANRNAQRITVTPPEVPHSHYDYCTVTCSMTAGAITPHYGVYTILDTR